MTTGTYYTQPILTARETARYLGMPESTLDVWLVDRRQQPLVHAVRPERRGWPRVPFVGVVEAYVLRALRDLQMPINDIRRAAELIRDEFKDPYALAHRRIASDGVALFVRMADESFAHARDRQLAIPRFSASTCATSIGARMTTPSGFTFGTFPRPRTSLSILGSAGARPCLHRTK